MSYKSKRTIVNMVMSVILFIAYLIYYSGANSVEAISLKSWAINLLIFAGIGVVTLVIAQILFHVGTSIGIAIKEGDKDDKEVEEQVERVMKSSAIEDERDKLIFLKSSRAGYVFLGIGFIAMPISLALGMSAIFAMNVLFGIGYIGMLIEGFVTIYLQEKGV